MGDVDREVKAPVVVQNVAPNDDAGTEQTVEVTATAEPKDAEEPPIDPPPEPVEVAPTPVAEPAADKRQSTLDVDAVSEQTPAAAALPTDDKSAPTAGSSSPTDDTSAPAASSQADGASETPPPADGQEPIKKTPEEEKTDREYNMYLMMSKSLTLQLPFERDRVIASKWVKKIEKSEEGDVRQRINYLKLLCVSMFSHKLAGPFQNVPKADPDFDDIAQLSSNDIINDLVDERNNNSIPPYFVEISGDLKEYVAYQEIPDFGAHFYYAFSTETITHWRNDKKAIVPAGGLNYSILKPPVREISKTADQFKSAYIEYAQNESRKLTKVPSDTTPNLMPELRKRKLITNDEISRMGSNKFIRKCPAASNVNQNRAPGTSVRGKPNANKTANGRPASYSNVRQARC